MRGRSARDCGVTEEFLAPSKALVDHVKKGLDAMVSIAGLLYTIPKERCLFGVMLGARLEVGGTLTWWAAQRLATPPVVNAANCVVLHEHREKQVCVGPEGQWLQQRPVVPPCRNAALSPLLIPDRNLRGFPMLCTYVNDFLETAILEHPVQTCDARAMKAVWQQINVPLHAVVGQEIDEGYQAAQWCQRFFRRVRDLFYTFENRRVDDSPDGGPPWAHTELLWFVVTNTFDHMSSGSHQPSLVKAIASWLLHLDALHEAQCRTVLNELSSATSPVADLFGPGGLLAHMHHCSRVAAKNGAPPFVVSSYGSMTAFEIALLQIAMQVLPIIAAPIVAKAARLLIVSGTRPAFFWQLKMEEGGSLAEACAVALDGPCCHRTFCRAHRRRLAEHCRVRSTCYEHPETDVPSCSDQCVRCREFMKSCRMRASCRATLESPYPGRAFPDLAPSVEFTDQGEPCGMRGAETVVQPRGDQRTQQCWSALDAVCPPPDALHALKAGSLLTLRARVDRTGMTEEQVLGDALHFFGRHLRLAPCELEPLSVPEGVPLCLPCAPAPRACKTCDTVDCSEPGLCGGHPSLASVSAVVTAARDRKGATSAVQDITSFRAEDVITSGHNQVADFVNVAHCAAPMEPALLEEAFRVVNSRISRAPTQLPAALQDHAYWRTPCTLEELRAKLSQIQTTMSRVCAAALDVEDWRDQRGPIRQHEESLWRAVGRVTELFARLQEEDSVEVTSSPARRALRRPLRENRRTIHREAERLESHTDMLLEQTDVALAQLTFIRTARGTASVLAFRADHDVVPTARNLRRITAPVLLALVAGPDAVPSGPNALPTPDAFRGFFRCRAAGVRPPLVIALRGRAASNPGIRQLNFVRPGSAAGFSCPSPTSSWQWSDADAYQDTRLGSHIRAAAMSISGPLLVELWSERI